MRIFASSLLVIICFVKSFHELKRSDFLVQPLAPAQLPNEATATSPSAAFASAGLTFKDLGEGARSGNAATVATLQLASSHAGGASGLAFRHRHHAAFRRARARSCHTQLTLSACRPHWREVVLSSSCASERVRRSPQCGGSRDCQAPSRWRRALPCSANVTVHRLASHARCRTTASIGRGTCCNAGPGRTVGCCIWYACHLAL